MKFRKFKVKVFAKTSTYGFEYEFHNGLNIIKGDNSSGKSTLINSLIYSVGMEEIIGSKGISSLPYALKSYFELDGKKVDILESVTIVEIENSYGEVKTFKRAITSKDKDTKLVEIINGDYLTNNESDSFTSSYTFLHDAGSAQDKQLGFFAFFENFLGFELPTVSNNNGGESKLYLQTIFSSMFIEQKRGWTNYIANTPYYPISGIREKIVSYLLDLDKFRNEKKLDKLTTERKKIAADWAENSTCIKLLLKPLSLVISGLTSKPIIDFRKELVNIGEGSADDYISIQELITQIAKQIQKYEQKEKEDFVKQEPDLVAKIENLRDKISELMLLHKMCSDDVRINVSKRKQYQFTLQSVLEDLKRNKLTKKVNEFGAEFEMKVAKNECPVCLTPLDGTLAPPENASMSMSIEENIQHLESQKTMIESLINGLDKEINREKASEAKISKELKDKKAELNSCRKDMIAYSKISETDIRIKVGLENRYSSLIETYNEIEEYLTNLEALSKRYQYCQSSISELNKFSVSYNDSKKIETFQTTFQKLASKFEYRSANVEEISINPNSLIPYLEGLELREYSGDVADIKADSSASDFVRLIWAYLISIYQVSRNKKGNHPGVILFDEPAQHSMGLESVNEMLRELSLTHGLQSIVAASFDQSDAAFDESTKQVDFHLIELPRKLIQLI